MSSWTLVKIREQPFHSWNGTIFIVGYANRQDRCFDGGKLLQQPLLVRIAADEEGPTARASIEALLHAAVESFCKPGLPRGCFLVFGAINTVPANKNVQNCVRGLRVRRQKVIQQRLQRAVDEGELPVDLDLVALAAFYTTVIDGLAIQARDGVSRKALNFAAHCAMAAWDPVVQATPHR